MSDIFKGFMGHNPYVVCGDCTVLRPPTEISGGICKDREVCKKLKDSVNEA